MSDQNTGRQEPRRPAEQKGYFLLDFLVVDFFAELFFAAAFFLAMALSPPFVARIYELQK
ncbi:MAG TPA: hypothetical protein VGR35_07695 [Tepidisphaeraceae bacterium]|nr:hypothetical protein [Tepidisphaeraceae bacterium]